MANEEPLRSTERLQGFGRALSWHAPQQLKRVRTLSAAIRASGRKRPRK